MIIPPGIEGDYLETKKNNLFFDIKGLHHPKNRKICYIRFYPNSDGDRLKENIKFKKVYAIEDRFSLLREKYPEYIYFSKNLNLEVQSVRNRDIKKIYTPLSYFEEINQKIELTDLEDLSKNLCKLFIQKGDLPESSIGISGSPMVGLNKNNSDIDIIIYGTYNSRQFQEKLKEIYLNSKDIRQYSQIEYQHNYKWRFGGSKIEYMDYLRSESRKLHQGKYHNQEFFIRYIKSPKDWKGNYEDYHYKDLGKITVKAKVIDSSDSIFTPCSYQINCLTVIDRSKKSKEVSCKDIAEINSFRGRYSEQAAKGDEVLVTGKLEKVIFKEEEVSYRILLTDQKVDRMIITS